LIATSKGVVPRGTSRIEPSGSCIEIISLLTLQAYPTLLSTQAFRHRLKYPHVLHLCGRPPLCPRPRVNPVHAHFAPTQVRPLPYAGSDGRSRRSAGFLPVGP